jgi:hypothetical protein
MMRSSDLYDTNVGMPLRRGVAAGRHRARLALAAACTLILSSVAVDANAQATLPVVSVQSIVGPNVMIFDPSMPQTQIQASVDAIASQQISNQFGTARWALLFKPGTYGSAAAPLNFQVGYYTSVAGLGLSPTDVVINGSINVYNQCDASGCVALNNFWRSLSNLTINVNNAAFGCHSGNFWAVSQAAPMRRVNITGLVSLMDYCTGPSFASGGFIADSQFSGSTVINGSQQQWIVRNSNLDGWTNGVWNQVFSGVVGAPANCFPASASCGGPYTTLAASPVTREAPFPYVDANGHYKVFVPAVQTNSTGTTWSSNSQSAGTSLPIERFFIAKPDYPVSLMNIALALGFNLILTPGIYHLDHTLVVSRPDTVVLGVGFPTLVPDNGQIAMSIGDVPGVKVSGVMFDAGPASSPVLLQVGTPYAHRCDPADPTTLSDVFFRIGGATAGKAKVSLVVNSDNVVLDNVWAWRADHGNGVGWTLNTADTGLIVNGDNVTAYGLFVEHYQKSEVIWNGNGGSVIFFQNEMPYDPPSQAAWMESPNVLGWPAIKVADSVKSFNGYGMGSYSFFNQGIDIFASNAFEVPGSLPAGSLHDLLTIFLDASKGRGGILNVVNGVGGSSTIANPDSPVTVVNYP